MKTFVIAIFVFLAGTAHAQSLWRDSRVGMTMEEVQAVYPAAHLPLKAGALHGAGLKSLSSMTSALSR